MSGIAGTLGRYYPLRMKDWCSIGRGAKGMRSLALTLLPGSLAVCRLGPDEPVPGWAWGGPLAAVVRTAEELSVVCAEAAVPEGVRCERGWRVFQIAGPFAFSEVGVVASLT